MNGPADLHSRVSTLKAEGQPFALATVVRTVATTAAKAGAKAIIYSDGTVTEGWIGGGCARVAVLKAAKDALATGTPKLISILPEDMLDASGIDPGETRGGIRYTRNMCPSQGTMDIFIEPVLPEPELVICGASPVAIALADLGHRMGYSITVCASAENQLAFQNVSHRIEGFVIDLSSKADRFTVVATQGNSDEATLRAALAADTAYIAFVGSKKKADALKSKLSEEFGANTLSRLHAPAGLNLGAITPEEIALSILAEITTLRRSGQRNQEA